MYNFGYHSALLSYVGRYNMGWFVYQTAIRLRMHIRTHQLVRNVLCFENKDDPLVVLAHPRLGSCFCAGIIAVGTRAYILTLTKFNFNNLEPLDMLGHGSGTSGGKHQPLRAH
jgi:hypothetical protein